MRAAKGNCNWDQKHEAVNSRVGQSPQLDQAPLEGRAYTCFSLSLLSPASTWHRAGISECHTEGMGLAWPWKHLDLSDLVPVTLRPLGGVGSIEDEHCSHTP